MNNILPGWELDGMPDMSTYAHGARGVALVVGPDGTWHAGRIADLHDLDAVAAMARRRGRPDRRPPARRSPPRCPATPPARPGRIRHGAAILTLPTPRQVTARTRPTHSGRIRRPVGRRPARRPQRRRGGPARRHAQPRPPSPLRSPTSSPPGTPSTPPSTMTRKPTGLSPSPAPSPNPVLALLDERGDAGARRDEIVAEIGRSRRQRQALAGHHARSRPDHRQRQHPGRPVLPTRARPRRRRRPRPTTTLRNHSQRRFGPPTCLTDLSIRPPIPTRDGQVAKSAVSQDSRHFP